MRRLTILKLYLIVIMSWAITGYAANVQPYIMDSSHFYALSPNQHPLSEQFATIVNSPPTPLNVTQTRPVKIIVLLSGEPNSVQNHSLLTAFTKRMQELKIQYQLIRFQVPEEKFDAKVFAQIKRDKADYLLVTKLDLVQSRYVEQVLLGGSTKVILYNMATPFWNWQNHSPLMYVGFDQVKAVDMLASYLDRQLPKNANIAAFVVRSGYIADRRCDAFLDAMAREKRVVEQVRVLPDDKQSAYQEGLALLQQQRTDFVFSCTQNISDGVIAAIKQSKWPRALQTNSWGLSEQEVDNLSAHRALVSVVFMWDDLAIAVAEGIKKNMEGEALPKLYIARSALMSSELDLESLKLMMQQAFRYSAVSQ